MLLKHGIKMASAGDGRDLRDLRLQHRFVIVENTVDQSGLWLAQVQWLVTWHTRPVDILLFRFQLCLLFSGPLTENWSFWHSEVHPALWNRSRKWGHNPINMFCLKKILQVCNTFRSLYGMFSSLTFTITSSLSHYHSLDSPGPIIIRG